MTRVIYPNRFALYFFAAIAIITLGVYYYAEMFAINIENSAHEQIVATQIATTTTRASSSVDTTGWKIYRNEKYGFELRYPSEWHAVTDKDRIFSFTARGGLKGEFFLDTRSTMGPSGDYGRAGSSVFLGEGRGLEDGGAACEYESNSTGEPCYFRANYVSSDTAQRGLGFALLIRNIPDNLAESSAYSSWVYFAKEIKTTHAVLSTLIFFKATQ